MRSLVLLAALAVSFAAAAWDFDTALEGVYWSKIAYCTDANIDTWSCSACPKFSGVTHAKAAHVDFDDDSSGFVAYYPAKNQIIYAFRGTVNLGGWVEDFDFFQTPYPNCSNTGCKVHEGLYWGYNRVRAELWDHLQSLVYLYPNATVFVTGHSMGAGQSGYAYLDVVLNLKGHTGKKMLYNYGCPRLGNQAFVEYMDSVVEPHGEHFRQTNFGDPIVHLAPLFFDDFGKLLGTWLHSPREVFFMNPFADPKTNPPKICNGNTTKEDPTCADSTPWYDMLGFTNHTTYMDVGLGCFLGPPPVEQAKMNARTARILGEKLKGKMIGTAEHKLNRLGKKLV